MKSQPNAIIADGLRNRKAKGLSKYTFGVSVMTRDYWCADYYNFDVYTFLLTLPHYFDLGPAARDGAIARWDDDFSEMAQMKYWQALRYLTFVGFAGAGFAAPTVAHATCTGGSTLSGYYGMEVSGQVPAGYGKFLNGVVYFNGSCALQVTATVGENQTVQSFVTFLGTYSTNPDNTITITFTPPGASAPETYNVAFTPVFNEALGIETDPSAIASIDIKAQNYPAYGNHNVYNTASLKGTWAAMCSGAMGSYSDLNYITFDGSTSVYGVFGNVTGVNNSNDLDSYASASIAGPYGVNSNGTFGGYSVVGATTVGFSGVIDNNLNEIQYNVSTAGSAGYDVESCVAKRVK